MAEYDNNNSGALYKNDKKTNKKQPALRGFFTLEGTEYWASAWKKVSKETGKMYISIALQQKEIEDPETFNAELHPIEAASEKAPTMGGQVTLEDGKVLDLVAWIRRKSSDNQPFYSIKVDESEGGGDDIADDDDFFFGMVDEDEGQPDEGNGGEDDFDDDIPF